MFADDMILYKKIKTMRTSKSGQVVGYRLIYKNQLHLDMLAMNK